MAAKKQQEQEQKRGKRGLSGDTTVVTLFYDGDKYKDPVFVGINGMNWVIQRGVPVEIPVEVAAVLENQMKQDKSAAQMVTNLKRESATLLGD